MFHFHLYDDLKSTPHSAVIYPDNKAHLLRWHHAPSPCCYCHPDGCESQVGCVCLVTQRFVLGALCWTRWRESRKGVRSVQLSDLFVVISNKLTAPGGCQLRMLMVGWLCQSVLRRFRRNRRKNNLKPQEEETEMNTKTSRINVLTVKHIRLFFF